MVKNSLESLITFHCAPTLAGIKAANLFTWHHTNGPSTDSSMDVIRAKLAPYGISMEVLCRCDSHALIFVYRADMLRGLFTAEAERFLEGCGYAAGSDIAEKIAALKSRLVTCGEFPHEIGVFLGYPLEDVRGFIEKRGEGCKACGAWKVYGDRESALALFERYKRCTEYFYNKFEAGCEMAQLLNAVPTFG